MPDAGEKARVEIEVAIRDMYSTALKSMGRELDNMNKKAQELGHGASSGLSKFKRENDQLHESTKRSSSSLASMSAIVSSLATNLTGPVGLVAGFYSAAKSMENFAVARIQLQNFSTDIGASVTMINSMSQAMGRVGISADEQRSAMSRLGGMAKDFAARGEGSALDALFNDTGVKAAERKRLLATTRRDFDQGLNDIIEVLNRGNAHLRRYRANEAQVNESVLQALQHHQEEKNKVYVSDLESARLWHEGWDAAILGVSNTWEFFNDKLTQFLVKGEANRQKMTHGLMNPYTLPTPNETVKNRWGKMLGDDSFSDRFPKEDDYFKLLLRPTKPSTFDDRFPKKGDFDSPSTFDERFPKAGVFGKRSEFGTATDFSGRRRIDESIQVDVDSNKTLREIRDTLQRMESGDVIGGGGGGGTAGAGTSYGTGARHGALQSGLGGFRPGGGGGSRGDRNNNPGNLKFGPHAQAFGATHADAGGFAVFPNAASGAAAQETLLKSDAYKGMTLDQFAGKYAEGNKSWSRTVGGALGIGGGDIVNNQDPRLPGAIRKAEGTSSSGEAGGGSGVPSNILTEAQSVAHLGGAAVKKYIQGKGYNVNDNWCGDFAAAVVTGAGGKPPKNYSVASSWRNWGTPVDDPQPGDIAIRKRSRYGGYTSTGAAGSHVNIVGAVDDEGFTGIGGNQGQRVSKFNRSAFEFRRGENDAARERIDKTESLSQRIDASMNATVDFKNMPSWVRSSIEDNGKFKKLSVTRSGPQNGKAGNALSDPNRWSYE